MVELRKPTANDIMHLRSWWMEIHDNCEGVRVVMTYSRNLERVGMIDNCIDSDLVFGFGESFGESIWKIQLRKVTV